MNDTYQDPDAEMDGEIDGDEDMIPPPAGPLDAIRMYIVPLLLTLGAVGALVLFALNAAGAIGGEPDVEKPEVFRPALAEREAPDLTRPEPKPETNELSGMDYYEPQTVVVSEREPATEAELVYPNEPEPEPEPEPPPPRLMRGTKPMTVAALSTDAATASDAGQGQTMTLGGDVVETSGEQASEGGAVRVARRMGDPGMTIPLGTTIPCALEAAILTAAPGPTSCRTVRDTYSADMSRVLIPRGSRVTGSAGVGTLGGADVVGVAWKRILAADVIVELGNDPAVSPLGAVGIEASVVRYFWRRFGGAVAVSLISDVGSAVVANAGQSDGMDVTVGATSSAGTTVVEEIVRRTVDIPATGSVHHGALVGVYLQDDLDFSAVYGDER